MSYAQSPSITPDDLSVIGAHRDHPVFVGHLMRTTSHILAPILALLCLAATPVAKAEIVPDEIEVTGASAYALTGDTRISPDELISIHRFKLSKGKWDISYKPGGVANLPFVWRQLQRDQGRNPQATIKMFKGRYNDKVKNLDLVLYIAPNGQAEIDVHDLDRGTKVRYTNLGHTDFFKEVYENN